MMRVCLHGAFRSGQVGQGKHLRRLYANRAACQINLTAAPRIPFWAYDALRHIVLSKRPFRITL